jgi:hypothetical protein
MMFASMTACRGRAWIEMRRAGFFWVNKTSRRVHFRRGPRERVSHLDLKSRPS